MKILNTVFGLEETGPIILAAVAGYFVFGKKPIGAIAGVFLVYVIMAMMVEEDAVS